MGNILRGEDALRALQQSGGGDNNEFTKFNVGTSYLVKVTSPSALELFYAYGVYKKTHTFTAKNPSTKDDNGFPIDNLTCWDKAYLHLRKEDEAYNSTANQEAYKYRAKQRYMMGFYDINKGENIVIDVSKPQALVLSGAIHENIDKLDDIVFRVAKSRAGESVKVSLSVVDNVSNLKKMKDAGIEADTVLTDEQIENFLNAPEDFDMSRFDGCVYKADDDEMIINLDKAGFDVSLLGLEVPKEKEKEEEGAESKSDANEEDYDF